MSRMVFNVSWRDHVPNDILYGPLPRISSIVRHRRLGLFGHVSRHNGPTGKHLLWSPEGKRRVGRPHITIKSLLEKDIGL